MKQRSCDLLKLMGVIGVMDHEDLEGPTAYAVNEQIKDDLPADSEYPRVELEVSLTYNRDKEEVNYLVKHIGEDSESSEVLVSNDAVLNHNGMSTEDIVDFLGGTMRDSLEEASIVVNGKYVRGTPSSNFRYTGEWKSSHV